MKQLIDRKESVPQRSAARMVKTLMLAMSFIFMVGFGCSSDSTQAPVEQKKIPYPENALEPYISSKTLKFHYGKHQYGYVISTNKIIKENKLKYTNLKEILEDRSKGRLKNDALFNNAAQAWNHEFFWQGLIPNGGGKPEGNVLSAINKSFGSYEAFVNEFILTATKLFGSGWVWLIQDNDQLKIVATNNADTPLAHGQKPLFTIDVWEHSYYLDYQNRRVEYVEAILENLVNWNQIELLMEQEQ
jgi:Fe-Mn family superoxide dismutase